MFPAIGFSDRVELWSTTQAWNAKLQDGVEVEGHSTCTFWWHADITAPYCVLAWHYSRFEVFWLSHLKGDAMPSKHETSSQSPSKRCRSFHTVVMCKQSLKEAMIFHTPASFKCHVLPEYYCWPYTSLYIPIFWRLFILYHLPKLISC